MKDTKELAPAELSPEARVARMRELLQVSVEGDMSDVEVLGEFIDLYEVHRVPEEERHAFYESLDLPDHDVIFGDETFDLIVAKYDALGGVPRENLPPGVSAVPSELERAIGEAYLSVASTAVLLQPRDVE